MEDVDFEGTNNGYVVREWGIEFAEEGTGIELSEARLGG